MMIVGLLLLSSNESDILLIVVSKRVKSMVGAALEALLHGHETETIERRGEQGNKVLSQVLPEHDVEEDVYAVVHVHEDLG